MTTTMSVVTFAYVGAYTGLMIGWGCAVWGSGYYYPPYIWPEDSLSAPAYLRYGCLVQPAHWRAWARLCRIRSVWRRWDGCVLQSSNGDLCTRCYRLRSLWVTLGRPGLQPSDRNLRPNATGLERLRKLGHELGAARRQLGADRASRELSHWSDHVGDSNQRRRRCGVAHRSRWGPDYRWPHGQRRRLCRPRWQRVSQERQRGMEQADAGNRPTPNSTNTRDRSATSGYCTDQPARTRRQRQELGDQRSTSRGTWQQGGSTRSGPKLRGRWTGAQRRRASTLAPVLQDRPARDSGISEYLRLDGAVGSDGPRSNRAESSSPFDDGA